MYVLGPNDLKKPTSLKRDKPQAMIPMQFMKAAGGDLLSINKDIYGKKKKGGAGWTPNTIVYVAIGSTSWASHPKEFF